MKSHFRPELVIAAGAVTVFLAMGIRQSFGLFLVPVTTDLGIGRESFSLSIALQNLIFGLPLLAMLADRIGARSVLLFGAVLYSTGLLFLSSVSSSIGLHLTIGIAIGLAQSAVGYVVILGAVAQAVPSSRRSTAFGMVTAAGSLGMFGMVPLAQWLLSTIGWQEAFTVLALTMVAIALSSILLPAKTDERAEENDASLSWVLSSASRHPGYWLLTVGFFVCGFHVSFVATHLPAFLIDKGLAPTVGATSLSLIGLFNLFGVFLFGWLGDRYSKTRLLSIIYFSRAVVMTLFILLPLTPTSALIFGALIGLLWLATVPLTSGIVGQIFGIRYLSTLYGIVFFSHQLGAFLGVWLGGRAFDLTGSYGPVWLVSILLGLIAMGLHLPIDERSIKQCQAKARS
jgi:predicted MFS family arabinose efflux permease